MAQTVPTTQTSSPPNSDLKVPQLQPSTKLANLPQTSVSNGGLNNFKGPPLQSQSLYYGQGQHPMHQQQPMQFVPSSQPNFYTPPMCYPNGPQRGPVPVPQYYPSGQSFTTLGYPQIAQNAAQSYINHVPFFWPGAQPPPYTAFQNFSQVQSPTLPLIQSPQQHTVSVNESKRENAIPMIVPNTENVKICNMDHQDVSHSPAGESSVLQAPRPTTCSKLQNTEQINTVINQDTQEEVDSSSHTNTSDLSKSSTLLQSKNFDPPIKSITAKEIMHVASAVIDAVEVAVNTKVEPLNNIKQQQQVCKENEAMLKEVVHEKSKRECEFSEDEHETKETVMSTPSVPSTHEKGISNQREEKETPKMERNDQPNAVTVHENSPIPNVLPISDENNVANSFHIAQQTYVPQPQPNQTENQGKTPMGSPIQASTPPNSNLKVPWFQPCTNLAPPIGGGQNYFRGPLLHSQYQSMPNYGQGQQLTYPQHLMQQQQSMQLMHPLQPNFCAAPMFYANGAQYNPSGYTFPAFGNPQTAQNAPHSDINYMPFPRPGAPTQLANTSQLPTLPLTQTSQQHTLPMNKRSQKNSTTMLNHGTGKQKLSETYNQNDPHFPFGLFTNQPQPQPSKKVQNAFTQTDQPSPSNESVKRVYDREVLMALRYHPESKIKPDNLLNAITRQETVVGDIDTYLSFGRPKDFTTGSVGSSFFSKYSSQHIALAKSTRFIAPMMFYKTETDVEVQNEKLVQPNPKDVIEYNTRVINKKPSLQYKEGQWSPFNQSGKKVYDKKFLMALRHDPKSKIKPENLPDILTLEDRRLGDRRYPPCNITRVLTPACERSSILSKTSLPKAPQPVESIESVQIYETSSNGSNIKTSASSDPLHKGNMFTPFENIGNEINEIPMLESRSKELCSSNGPSLEHNYRQSDEGNFINVTLAKLEGDEDSSSNFVQRSYISEHNTPTLECSDSLPNNPLILSKYRSAPKTMDPKQMESNVKNILEEYLNNSCTIAQCDDYIKGFIHQTALPQLVMDIFNNALERSRNARLRTGFLFAQLIKLSTLPVGDYCMGLEEVLSRADALSIGVPKIWDYLAEVVAPVMWENELPVNRLLICCNILNGERRATKLLPPLFKLVIGEKGPYYLLSIWKLYGLSLSDFMSAGQINKFVKEHMFDFLMGESFSSESHSDLTYEQIHDKLLQLQSMQSLDEICKSINSDIGFKNNENQLVRPPREMSPLQLKLKFKNILDEHLNNCCTSAEYDEDIKGSIPTTALSQLVAENCFNVVGRSKTDRLRTGFLFCQLIKSNTLPIDYFCVGLEEVITQVDNLTIDIPKIWEHLAEIVGPVMWENALSLNRLLMSCNILIRRGCAQKLLAPMFKLVIGEKGSNYLFSIWQMSRVSLSDFMPEEQVNNFIKENRFEFLTDGSSSSIRQSDLRCEHRHDNDKSLQVFIYNSFNDIFKWIKANKRDEINAKQLIRTLGTCVFGDSIMNSKLKIKNLKNHTFARFIDGYSEDELDYFFALRTLLNKLKHRQGIPLSIHNNLYEHNVFSHNIIPRELNGESVEQEGKGVALKQLKCFFIDEAKEEDAEADDA